MKRYPEEYYNDEEQHGSYQYVTLKKIVDDFVYETLDDDSILKNTKRGKIIRAAKEAILDLNKNTFNEPRVVEITVPDELSLPLPHDFVSFLRLSVVVEDKLTNSYRLHTLDKNNKIHTSISYLQDENFELLFDHDGYVLTANAYNSQNTPYKRYKFVCGGDNKQISRNGEFTIDEQQGKILFSSDLYDKPIVLEYLTDGLGFDTYGEEEIKVHKDSLEVLKNYIYYLLIKFKRHVSQSEKQSALKRFKTTRHETRLKRAKFNLIEISRVARNANF
ncbi:hypothetical protein [Tenacibaculum sp. 190524A02b]|uniref:hypothetical protein n=1 Tax=Tenacibaculum vairaonense TaxID=3137860 RepID=UPI0031FAB67B